MIDFYSGINETQWNGFPVCPGPLVCIAPVYGSSKEKKRENRVFVPDYVEAVIEDSSAFCDGPDDRLSPEEALDRQYRHMDKYDYATKVWGLASYDLLIDEKWENGVRHKRRWSENDAWEAVGVTINSAEYLSRKVIKPAKILSAQGVTAEQYTECTYRILEYFDIDKDVFGLGGWCISGMKPNQLRPSFNATMLSVIPVLEKAGVKRVHIWGVIDITFLAPLLWLCDQAKIKLSTDSSGPQKRPAAYGEWGYRGWRNNNYKKPESSLIMGLHRAIHTEYTRDWLKYDVRNLKYYKEPDYIPEQLELINLV